MVLAKKEHGQWQKPHQSRGSSRDSECKRDGNMYGNDGISQTLVRLFKIQNLLPVEKRPSLFLESSLSPSYTFSSFSLILLPCPSPFASLFLLICLCDFSYISTYPFCPFLLSRPFSCKCFLILLALSIHFLQVPSLRFVSDPHLGFLLQFPVLSSSLSFFLLICIFFRRFFHQFCAQTPPQNHLLVFGEDPCCYINKSRTRKNQIHLPKFQNYAAKIQANDEDRLLVNDFTKLCPNKSIHSKPL